MTQSTIGADSIAHSGTPPAGATFGASLRALREARGWSVGDVSARLKFAPRQIEAIEADRWDDLPQGPSLRGLVRNYARLLDQDPETLMRAIPAHLQHQPTSYPHLRQSAAAVTDLTAAAPLDRWSGAGARRRRVWLAAIFWLIVICVLALAAYLVFAWWLPRMGNGNGQENLMPFDTPARSSAPAVTGQIVTPPAAQADAPVAPAPADPATAAAPEPTAAAPGVPATVPSGAPEGSIAGPNGAAVAQVQAQQAQAEAQGGATVEATPAPVAAKPNQVDLSVTTASWVEVRDVNGSVVLSATLQPGAKTSVEAAPPARVVIGNASGVQLQWQGAPVDLAPFRRGNVARLTLE